MTETCFHNHTDWVCKYLQQAKNCISIAMCWFSNRILFQTLISKLQQGILVELVIEFDEINIRDGGLDFDQFINFGGRFYAAKDVNLMHHKFAVVDKAILLTGSFNWTNNANEENILACDEPNAVRNYLQTFEVLKQNTNRLRQIDDLAVKSGIAADDVSGINHHENLRKKIAAGSKCWVVKLHKTQINDQHFFQKGQLIFDALSLSQSYWTSYTQFSLTHYENWLYSQNTLNPIQIRYLNTWYRRIRPDDLILPIGPKNTLVNIGLIQPGPPAIKNGSPFRSIQWLQIDMPQINLKGQYPIGTPVQYLGSGLQLLQTIFTTPP